MEGTFAEALARAAAETPWQTDDTPPLGEAIRAFRAGLRDVDDVGQLYVLLEPLIAAVRAAYPDGLCKAGCSGCCNSPIAIFDASPAEWALMERHMAEAWSAEERASFRARFEAEHRPRLGHYRWLSRLGFFEPLAERYFKRRPYRCPFLVNGRCSIYAARPLACRMYGYFAVRVRWSLKPGVYACGQQTAFYRRFRERGTLHLPNAELVAARLKRLGRGRGRILPLWIG